MQENFRVEDKKLYFVFVDSEKASDREVTSLAMCKWAEEWLVLAVMSMYVRTHTHPFNGPFAGTTRVSRYQKGKTNPDFNEARDGEWQWHQLGYMQVCT